MDASTAVAKPGRATCPAAPLMHGTGAFNAMWNLCSAAAVVTMVGRHFDPVELLDTIAAATGSTASPSSATPSPSRSCGALDAEPERWDISSLRVIVSSGVIWSAETKAGLLRHNDRLIMIDSLGSSEAIGMAINTTDGRRHRASTASFRLGPNTKVLTDDGREVAPGSGERGRVALRGRTPVGYYKDQEKSAATFRRIDGVRWWIPGDCAEVDADGTVRLLGRGSQCINTGGEKVYPEEVEEVAEAPPDASPTRPSSACPTSASARPSPRSSSRIPARWSTRPRDRTTSDATSPPTRHPSGCSPIDTIGRAANGKLDYKRLKASAAATSADLICSERPRRLAARHPSSAP